MVGICSICGLVHVSTDCRFLMASDSFILMLLIMWIGTDDSISCFRSMCLGPCVCCDGSVLCMFMLSSQARRVENKWCVISSGNVRSSPRGWKKYLGAPKSLGLVLYFTVTQVISHWSKKNHVNIQNFCGAEKYTPYEEVRGKSFFVEKYSNLLQLVLSKKMN